MRLFHRWPAHLILRTAGAVGLTALAGSTLTTAASSRLLLSSGALDEIAPLSAAAKEPKDSGSRLAKRAESKSKSKSKPKSLARHSQLVDNNIFCPSCKPAAAQPEPAPTQVALAPTDLPLVLLATMESDDPRASMASVLDTERKVTGVVGINDQLRAGVFVSEIRRGQLILRTDRGMQSLGLPKPDEPKRKKKKKKKRRKKKKKKKRGSREIAGAREAIKCRGNSCTVERDFVDHLMANPHKLTRQAKIVPSVKDGDIRGFRLARVRRGTLPNLLGLRNGDTLLSVNGHELDSMDRAMGLYAKLRRASHLSVTVERKGKVFEKQIAIR